MFNLVPVFEFSRNNCLAICAFLVPANLLITLQILIALAMERPIGQIRLAVALAITFALTLFLHVFTWFAIGVVTPVTFILFTLGTTCLVINISATIYWQKFPQLVRSLRKTIFALSLSSK